MSKLNKQTQLRNEEKERRERERPVRSMREGITSSDTKFRENKSHMKKTLKGIATEPKSERSGRTLVESGEDDGGGNHHKSEVPDHVDHQHRP